MDYQHGLKDAAIERHYCQRYGNEWDWLPFRRQGCCDPEKGDYIEHRSYWKRHQATFRHIALKHEVAVADLRSLVDEVEDWDAFLEAERARLHEEWWQKPKWYSHKENPDGALLNWVWRQMAERKDTVVLPVTPSDLLLRFREDRGDVTARVVGAAVIDLLSQEKMGIPRAVDAVLAMPDDEILARAVAAAIV